MNRLFFSALFLSVLAFPAAAQDAHYWTLQYGPRSSLLGAAVIGSVADISGVYYNPGALALADDLAFAVSTSVFEATTISLEDGGGQGVDLGTTTSGIRPSLIAGSITNKLFGNGILAYSVLTRAKGTQDLEGVAIVETDDIDPGADLSDLVAQSRFEGRFTDTWGGLSFSYPVGSHLGIGLSWWGAFRTQSRRRTNLGEAIANDGTGGATIDVAGGKYSTIRTLGKLGAFGAFGPVTAGVTLTTPSLHIAGGGQLGINQGAFGPDTAALAVDVQTDLPAEYKTPLSVGFGASVLWGRTRLHGSGEWFDALGRYVVIQGEPFVAQQPPDTIARSPVHSTKEVLNWGVGLEHGFSERTSGYLSFYTDNSALADSLVNSALSVIPIDIKTLTAGADFTVSSVLLTLGLGFSWGSKIDQGLTDIIKRDDEDFVATFVFRGFRAVFGFEIGI